MRIMPAFNIMYNELDNAGIESINAFQYDTGIDPTNTIRHNANLVLYQDAETSHMPAGLTGIVRVHPKLSKKHSINIILL